MNNQNNVLILLSSQTMNTTTKKLILISTLLLSFLIIAWCSIDTPEKKDQSSITEYIVDQSDMLDTAKLLDTISTWIISDQEKIPENLILIAKRRKQAREEKDFQLSDDLRKEIERLGYVMEDLKGNDYLIKKL